MNWQPPPDFERHAWDEDGLLGDEPRMGRFWDHPDLTPQQRREFLKARIVLQGFLKKLGKTDDNYGLVHADFLPDNIIVNAAGLTLIDFDDSGYGWHLYEMATGLFPQIKQPFFDDLVASYVEGYRSEREFSDEEAKFIPAFLLICGLNYLGWLQKRGGNLKYADRLAAEIISGLLEYIPQLMAKLSATDGKVDSPAAPGCQPGGSPALIFSTIELAFCEVSNNASPFRQRFPQCFWRQNHAG
jgi:Ser/Thr protein kinase RdoA (MazF antagonist)